MNNVPTIEEMRTLVDAGLVSEKKQTPEGFADEFSIFKYKNKVFYNNLWNQSPMLLESRGIVFDHRGELVQLPLTKVFNLNENGTHVHPNTRVMGCRKVNGFMLAVTKYNGKLFYSSTGSLRSDFVKLGAEVLIGHAHSDLKTSIKDGYTFIFEICHSSDPHIVDEKEGAYLLAVRDKVNGRMVPSSLVYQIAISMGVYGVIPEVGHAGRFIDELDSVDHEGYMLYDYETKEPLVKLKSPHYLSKKAIMRLGKGKVGQMFGDPEGFKKRLDEEFYGVLDHILWGFTADEWRDCDEQRRRHVIETYFDKVNSDERSYSLDRPFG